MGILSLPEEFETRMEAMLGEEEYAEFLSAFERERSRGLRLNPLKLSSALRMECERNPEGFRETAEMPDGMKTAFSEFGLRPVPWAAPFGFFYDEAARPGKSPLHEAGLYYLQEPSAMSVAALAEVHPGDKVLDLCAAPGGKSTMLAGALMGEGLLISNEINPGRAKILSQNIERMGISNAIVTNETPEKLAQRFPSFFDKVIVDAPCSGEGMFRKEEQALAMWSPENVAACAKRQAEILDQAAVMVKSGGELVYSTCTFAPAEDENSILSFLERHPEFSMTDLPEKLGEKREAFGFDTGHPEWCGKPEGAEELRKAVRLWPHRLEGEGHFAAVLQKTGERLREEIPSGDGHPAAAGDFIRDTLQGDFMDRLAQRSGSRAKWFGDDLYLMPFEASVRTEGLRILRPGLGIGTVKKGRFEPAHALAMAMQPGDAVRALEVSSESREAAAYLRGETLPCDASWKGWTLVTIDGISAGWGKASGGILKNHYPKGLRRSL